MISITLSGATYPIRHEIRALGGVWQHEQKRYLVPVSKRDHVSALIAGKECTVGETEAPDNIFEPLTGEALRAYRQAKSDRKSEKYRARSVALGAKAEALFDKEHKIMDMIPLGQPILCGHHSQRRHEKDLERINRLGAQACEAFTESQRLERVANRLSAPVAIKGDAEARHEAHRQRIRDTVKVGEFVKTYVYGDLEVLKINQKTLKLKGKFGNFNVDMSLCYKIADVPE